MGCHEYESDAFVYVEGHNMWLTEAQSTETVRSGFGLHGVYPFDKDKPIIYDRSESDLEHGARVEGLIFWALSNSLCDFLPTDQDFVILPLAGKIHDYAERYCGGDIPANGTRPENQDEKELKCFRSRVLVNYPLKLQVQLEVLLTEFMGKSSKRGQLIYCADKTDAILRGLYYEQLGLLDPAAKLAAPSDDDRRRAGITGTDSLVDNWTLDFLERSEDFREQRLPFLKLIKEGCSATAKICIGRPKWFPWWERYFEMRGLKSQII